MTIAPSVPTIAEVFGDWVKAELACHYAQPCPDELMDHLTTQAWENSRRLAEMPAGTAQDLLFKVFPILLANCEARSDQPPLAPEPQSGNGDPDLIRSIVEDMARLVPEIAAAMTAPNCATWRCKEAA